MIVGEGEVVDEGVIGVFVTLGVDEGVTDGVSEDVRVTEGVNVAGTKGVRLSVLVGVMVGVGVGVFVTVLVRTVAVGLRVSVGGVTVCVNVGVTEGVRSDGSGASAMAIQPMQ